MWLDCAWVIEETLSPFSHDMKNICRISTQALRNRIVDFIANSTVSIEHLLVHDMPYFVSNTYFINISDGGSGNNFTITMICLRYFLKTMPISFNYIVCAICQEQKNINSYKNMEWK